MFFPFTFLRAVGRAKKILNEQKPDILFSKGGYVSLPLCYAAKKQKIPIILHESDSVSGNANKIVAKWADKICTGFPNLATYQHNHITTYTGNPVRAYITEGSKKEGLSIAGFDGTKPVLLVMGGSQGAKAINEAVMAQLDDLLLRCDIIHITGRGKSHHASRITHHYYQTEIANK